MAKQNTELKEERKLWFDQMERKLHESWSSKEDSLFYNHSSEDRIVLSHAMFWTMTQLQFFKSKLRKEKFFLLLRQYQEEILDAFLQDDDYFPELLHTATSSMSCCLSYWVLRIWERIRMPANLPPSPSLPLAMLVTWMKSWLMNSWMTSTTISIRWSVGRLRGWCRGWWGWWRVRWKGWDNYMC